VFGISHLPPFHLSVLAALADRVPVYLFLLNPCRHFWSDIMSEQQMSRIRAAREAPAHDSRHLHLEQGNRLLASWGEQGKQFVDSIHQLDGHFFDLFDEQPRRSMLGHIQDDILNLRDLPEPASALDVDGDNSLQIHVCHSPMREVEVLYDQLLFMLDNDPELKPRDILVMTPDIATYAPFIHAVFGTPFSDETAIPYSVADQNLPTQSPTVEGFLQLLDLYQSRFEVSKVLNLLEYDAIRDRFGIAEIDIDRIEQWVRAVNIHWGWDGSDRGRFGLPRFESNTWRQGIDRLVLGYAVMGDDRTLMEGKLPFSGMDINDSQLLGNFVEFAESLHRALNRCESPATLSQWHDILSDMVDTFITADQLATRDLQILRKAVNGLGQIAAWSNSDGLFPFEVVRDVIQHTLGRASYGSGFLAGSVTFCAMLPMRSIPSKVICLLGMGHDKFPRESKEPTFNLMATHPRPGDRSKRDDDKYLFLEALISARSVFYLSYVGRDIQDNSVIPPSVVVNELIEYAREGYGISLRWLVTEHPLQAFSPAYFNRAHPRLFSYSHENAAASARLGRPERAKPFFESPLSALGTADHGCDLRQLTAFFSHPCRFLLQQRLGIFLHDLAQPLEDREKFNLDALDGFRVSQKLFELTRSQYNHEASYRILKAAGEIPHGTAGKICLQRLQRDVDAFLSLLKAHMPDAIPVTESVESVIEDQRVEAEIGEIYPDVRVAYRMAKVRPSDILGTFLGHLVMLSAADSAGRVLPQTSLLICKDAVWRFGRVPDAGEVLGEYLHLFRNGYESPLRFFPKASFAYAHHRLVRGKSPQESLAAATRIFDGGHYAPAAESQDPYIRLCFRGLQPLDSEFEETAVRIFDPMLSAGSARSV
jgi:exodeoxyribonuclease V gamma subunit